jgi:putative SOS response-associated peptidase YedK
MWRPASHVGVVTDPEARSAHWMKWGLIPFWAKDPAIGNKMINARSETMLEKPSFKRPLQAALPGDCGWFL